MSACRACGQPLAWYRTTNGKPIPLDPDPREDGNVEIISQNGGHVAKVLTKAEMVPNLLAAPAPRYVSHFTTCPNWSARK